MKNNSNTSLSLVLTAILLANNAPAQMNFPAMSDLKISVDSVITKSTQPHVQATPYKYIDAKVARSFIKNFKNAENVHWREGKKNYVVEFSKNGRPAVAWFTKSGRLYCAHYHGSGKHLPAEYRKMLERVYGDYLVIATLEIRYTTRECWIVTIENCSNARKIKMIDDYMEEIEHLRKAADGNWYLIHRSK